MEQQNEFKGWARVEVMGHQSHIGFVQTEAYGGAVLFRIDAPTIPESPERTLTQREWTGEGYLPVGAVVKDPEIPGVSVLVGAGSIYRIVPCTEDAALLAIKTSARRPLMLVSIPALTQIEAPAPPPACCPEYPSCNCAESPYPVEED